MTPLLSDPHPDHARGAFATKPRAAVDKVTTVREAVARLVNDGDYFAGGGFSTNRIPVAVLHEIVRQKKQNLRVAGYTTTHALQILFAGNRTGRGQTVAAIDAAYVVGLEARGLSPHSRRVMQSGDVTVVEWSNYTLALRFQAAAMGVPFLPARSLLGTDTLAHNPSKTIICPYTGLPLVAVPALYPDVAAIHVHEADRFGNARFSGTSVADPEIARAAKKLIITCERLLGDDDLRYEPHRNQIPFFCVDAVCHVPKGSFPGGMPGEYPADERHLKEWMTAEADETTYTAFVAKHIFETPDFEGYLASVGNHNIP
jgi:glutaconate CoA-transferase subunit A